MRPITSVVPVGFSRQHLGSNSVGTSKRLPPGGTESYRRREISLGVRPTWRSSHLNSPGIGRPKYSVFASGSLVEAGPSGSPAIRLRTDSQPSRYRLG